MLAAAQHSAASFDLCERWDGDCSVCPHLAKESPTGRLELSRLAGMQAQAKAAERVLASHSAGILQMEPLDQLHTSLVYTCCHSTADVEQMKRVLQQLSWHSFQITYSGFGCNLDMHQERPGDLIYLHILPDRPSQARLFGFVDMLNKAFTDAGVKVNHPRKSLFHMTLLRANSSYPVDSMVERLLNDAGSTTVHVCCFNFQGRLFYSVDGCEDPQLCEKQTPGLMSV